mgnify:CR=1 FL=1|jgi:hypothetical protein
MFGEIALIYTRHYGGNFRGFRLAWTEEEEKEGTEKREDDEAEVVESATKKRKTNLYNFSEESVRT